MNEEIIKMIIDLQRKVAKLEANMTYNPYKGYFTSTPTLTDLPNVGDYVVFDDSGTIHLVLNVNGVLMYDKSEAIAAM